MNSVKKYLKPGIFMMVLLVLFATLAFKEQTNAAEKLMIPIGKSVAIPANGVKKILAVKEGIVEVLNVSDSEIILSGIGAEAGITQLILWDRSGRRVYDVETYSETEIIQSKFTSILGNPGVTMVIFPDSVYLKGQVSNESDKLKAEQIASSLIKDKKIVNLIEQETSVPSLQQRIEQAIKLPTVKVSVISPNMDMDKPSGNNAAASTTVKLRVVLEGTVKNQNDYIHLTETVYGFVDEPTNISNLVTIENPTQVVFQAYVLQVTKNNTEDLGIEWGKKGPDNSIITGVLNYFENSANDFRGAEQSIGAPVPNSINPLYSNNINRFDLIAAQVKAWVTKSKAKVLANPKLTVYANASSIKLAKAGWADEKVETEDEQNIEKDSGLAFVNVGQDIYYPAQVDNNGNITYEKAEASLKLMVRDMYVNGDELKFTVFAKQDEPSFTRGADAPPDILKRSLMTTVQVKDQETIVLGGLINRTNEVSWKSVPLLSKIPYLGRLFKSKSSSKRENELVILLTPKIMRDETDLSGNKKFKTIPVPRRSDKLEKLHKMFQQIKKSHLPVKTN